MGEVNVEDKLNFAINHINATFYKLILQTPVYNDAINLLTNTYSQAPNPMFASYALKTYNQQVGITQCLPSNFKKK